MQPKVDAGNTWSLCPNCNVASKLRNIYLCINRLRDVTYVESEKNGLEMTGLGNAMNNNVENEKNGLEMAGVG